MPVKVLQSVVKAVQTRERCISAPGERVPAASPTIPEASAQTESSVAASKLASAPSRVTVVEPNLRTRFHFKEILQSAHDFELAGDFSHTQAALTAVPHLRPDLLLLGIRRPDIGGIKCIKPLKRILIGLKIIIVLGAADMGMLDFALRSGANSCLIKPVSAAQCLATLRVWTSSRNTIPAEPQKAMPKLLGGATSKSCMSLSPRENEVMDALAAGLLYKEIADELGVSESLVHKHVHNIFEKLNVHNRSEAITVWYRERIGRFVPRPSNIGDKPTGLPIS